MLELRALMDTFEPLLSRMQELKDLQGAIGLMTWDQETYMPPAAEAGRATQLATLQGLYHERLTDPKVGDWLSGLSNLSTERSAMVRAFRKERDRAVRVPQRLVKELAEAQGHALGLWKRAREAKDFQIFRPGLERLITLRREQADAIGFDKERYEALLDSYEPGLKVERLSLVLEALKNKLVPMVRAIDALPPPRDITKGKVFPEDTQWALTVELLGMLGFDLKAGRQDKSVHPFTGGTSPTDVRLTTRLYADTPLPALFGTIHEAGHGLYEQGFAPAHYRTPLAQAPSMGLHESQSRLWENLVGRSAGFWSFFFPKLKARFPQQFADVTELDWLKHVNRVERTPIRVEADEVTYNLHIVLRYELELALFRGTLEAKDLEGAWSEKTKALLGLTPESVEKGVLQDIHWAWGEFGYFPTYALGNLYAASLWAAATKQLPELEAQVKQGQFAALKGWLREKIHHQGFLNYAEDTVKAVTGKGLTDEDFIAHVKTKYSALYGAQL
jgi:carboxypeptidase Taq